MTSGSNQPLPASANSFMQRARQLAVKQILSEDLHMQVPCLFPGIPLFKLKMKF